MTSSPTATPAPTATPHTHTWAASTHEEQILDHYEDGSPIYETQRTWAGSKIICNACGREFDNITDFVSHDPNGTHFSYSSEDIYEYQDVLVGYEQVPVYRTEVITDYEYCSVCGAIR